MRRWRGPRGSLALGVAALAFVAVALAGCDRADMVAQPKSSNWDRSTVFADESVMRQPVAGTEPRDEPNLPVPQPAVITTAMVTRGRQRFDIFCAPCHGRTGEGHGMIVERGFPAPPSLMEDGLVKAKASFIDDVIANGHGTMYSFNDRVPPADRWAIVAYIRALQVSRNAPKGVLTSADLSALEAKP